jgi:RNA polymerase sigma factor (sigma-70 family)
VIPAAPELRLIEPHRAAWEALVRRHTRQVLVSLLARGLTLEQAQELAQEAWTRLWHQHLRGALRTVELPGLAITQAGFLARDARRRLRHAPESADDARAAQDVVAPLPSAEARLASAQALEAVRRELSRLPESRRHLFELAQDGVPHAEIARRLQLTPQRVRQLVWEIRSRLRALLGAWS